MYYQWAPYVSVAERLYKAKQAMRKRAKQGHPVDPVCIEGRTIARSPWGKAWCENLESYSDFANRLPRGRRYARNGSLVDLQITSGRIQAYIAGSDTYRATIRVVGVPHAQWQTMCADCAGGIGSLIELLRGRLDTAIMQRLCRQGDGLFPSPTELRFSCSCPDGARMCKHIAAVLYGVGHRLDSRPELLFTLRNVDADELIASAGSGLTQLQASNDDAGVLDTDTLGELFGLDLDAAPADPAAPAKATRRGRPAGSRTRATTPPKNTARKTAARNNAPSKKGPPKKAQPKKAQRKAAPPQIPPPRTRDLYGKLYRRLAKAGSLTSAEAQVALAVTASELRPLFKRLLADGHATVTGRTRGTTYHIRRA